MPEERITWWQGLLVASTLATAAVTVWSAMEARAAVAAALKSLSPPPYEVSGPLVSLIVPTLNEQDYLPLAKRRGNDNLDENSASSDENSVSSLVTCNTLGYRATYLFRCRRG